MTGLLFAGVVIILGALFVAAGRYLIERPDHGMHAAPRGPRDPGRHAVRVTEWPPPHPRFPGIPGMEGPSVPVLPVPSVPPAAITDCPAVRSGAAWDSGHSGIHAAIRP